MAFHRRHGPLHEKTNQQVRWGRQIHLKPHSQVTEDVMWVGQTAGAGFGKMADDVTSFRS